MIHSEKYISSISINNSTYSYYDIYKIGTSLNKNISHLPFCLRVLLEGIARNQANKNLFRSQVEKIFDRKSESGTIPFIPSRVLLQDFTGIPVLNDLTGLRSAIERKGIDPTLVNPTLQTDLVVDHSVQVDHAGCEAARSLNEEIEFQRNHERYSFLKWSEKTYNNLQIFPPGYGIVHQIHLEHIANLAAEFDHDGRKWLSPDSVLGTDSHTPMINGMGVLGWGVGGIEAMAAMVGYPIEISIPKVVGLQLIGSPQKYVTPTDITLYITSILRKHGVVGKFVEVFGDALDTMRLEDRAMIANMSPENGATVTYFPVDDLTIEYLKLTGRSVNKIDLIGSYFKAQGFYRDPDMPIPNYDEEIKVNISEITPLLSGPKRPFDTNKVSDLKANFSQEKTNKIGYDGFGLSDEEAKKSFAVNLGGDTYTMDHGAVILAAITSCTNTANPYVMIGAGLLAKNAVSKGLSKKVYTKTSLTPGSQVVSTYLEKSGLQSYLDKLGFHNAGFGCATCIGNSGPIAKEIIQVVNEGLISASVISGNRNFEGRIHAGVKACYLASPLMVIAYAIAGSVNFDLDNDPLGFDLNNKPVFLADIWPEEEMINEYLSMIKPEIYDDIYQKQNFSNPHWESLEYSNEKSFHWDKNSTYLLEPPFLKSSENTQEDIIDARTLVLVGDSITTDHISPAGKISPESIAGKYLRSKSTDVNDLNTFGARRGNHEVLTRGTFGNIRLRNQLVGNKEGDYTIHFPDEEEMSIFEAAEKYKKENIPLIILAGKQYGTGSSRDWAAKGPLLLGVRAVVAESYERIHRSNLALMGILPLQFIDGENAQVLKLKGNETFTIKQIQKINQPGQKLTVHAAKDNGETFSFKAIVRLDSESEISYFHQGGILPAMLNDFSTQR